MLDSKDEEQLQPRDEYGVFVISYENSVPNGPTTPTPEITLVLVQASIALMDKVKAEYEAGCEEAIRNLRQMIGTPYGGTEQADTAGAHPIVTQVLEGENDDKS
jgi:hypothetical protein